MPRPREFDERQAVDSAMRAFWSHGYEGTSTQELCAATGLGRSSIYNTFSSKRELFLRSLDHYCDMAYERRMAALATDRDAAAKLRALLSDVIAEEFAHGHRGCLVVNTTAELGGQDAGIQARLRRDADRQVGLLTDCMRAGQREGFVGRGKDATTLARFLHATIAALRLMSRGGSSRADIEAAAEVALDAVLS